MTFIRLAFVEANEIFWTKLSFVPILLDRFPSLPIDQAIADLAARLRRRFRWKLPDAFQAALARHHGLTLVTRNTRDFSPDRFDFVDVPYTI